MSLDHIESMLKTLQQYNNFEITLTFKNKHQVPILLVRYHNKRFQLTYLNNHTIETYDYNNKCFQLTYLNNHTIETYDYIEPAVSAIDKALQSDLKEASK